MYVLYCASTFEFFCLKHFGKSLFFTDIDLSSPLLSHGLDLIFVSFRD